MSNFSIENIGTFELNRASVLLSDGALETTAQNPGPMTGRGWTGACCGRVDDGELEAMAMNPGSPTKPGWTGMCCGRIDDGALEASVGPGPGGMTMFPRCSPRIDADAN